MTNHLIEYGQIREQVELISEEAVEIFETGAMKLTGLTLKEIQKIRERFSLRYSSVEEIILLY